uniref:Uncharacterized protein n=1 Tax=Arundo donax TaxID=35708 RepID=A0A0A9GJJ8_ARUDO
MILGQNLRIRLAGSSGYRGPA